MGVRSYDIAGARAAAYTDTAGVTTNAVGASAVRISATTDCWVTLGADPTAVVDGDGSFLLPALSPIEMACKATDKVSAVQVDTGGTLSVLPIA